MELLVIGGTRLTGPHLVRQAVAAGHRVTVFHRGRTEAALPPEVEHVHSELAGIPLLAFPRKVLSRKFDAVVHMNAMGLEDTRAAVAAFRRHCRRMVWASSGDVYRAYGRFRGSEGGPLERGPLGEDSPLRTVLFPYRAAARSPKDLEHWYDKILMERTALSREAPQGIVLRFPKVYGRGGNDDFASVHAYRGHPDWRWTHGYAENVAAALLLAATASIEGSRIYNVGEEVTPTVGERLKRLPPSVIPSATDDHHDFEQDLVYDTRKIRKELGYREIVGYEEGIRRTLER